MFYNNVFERIRGLKNVMTGINGDFCWEPSLGGVFEDRHNRYVDRSQPCFTKVF